MPSVADLTDQDMRDTAVTWLIAAGNNLEMIASATGHEMKTIADVIRHYMGHHPHISAETGAKLTEWIDKQRVGNFGTPMKPQ